MSAVEQRDHSDLLKQTAIKTKSYIYKVRKFMFIYVSIQRYVTIHVDQDNFLPTTDTFSALLQMLLGNANGRRRTIEKRGILVTSLTL
jgi:hypothetical protein